MDKPHAESRKSRRRDRKAQRGDSQMAVISDSRFAEVHTNPRFKKPYRNKSKVTVDSRFKQMFHDKNFGGASSGNVDKYGRKLEAKARAPGADLKKFYHLEEEEEEEEEEERLKGLRLLARGDVGGVGSSDSSSDEGDDNVEDKGEDEDRAEVESEPEDKIPLGEASSRIAVQNLDWDKLQALDILVLLSSFLPATGAIRSVAVHKSKYGEERMAIEDRFGPQIDPHFVPPEPKPDGDADEGVERGDDGETVSVVTDVDKGKLRKYEQQRLKYYFAVVEFDSATTANHVYEECDGVEFEHSAIVFDLRFIPDDISIDTTVREQATSVPEDYKAPEFVTKALQSTNVELSWDGDDPKRDRLRKWGNAALKGKELVEDKDLEAFIGSDSSSEEDEADDGGMSKAQAREKFRSLLQAATNDSSEEEEEDKEEDKEENESEGDRKNDTVQGDGGSRVSTLESSRGHAQQSKESKSAEAQGAAVDKSVFNDPFFMNPSKHNRRAKIKQQKKKLREKREERAKSEAKSKAELELLLMEEHGKEGKSNEVTGFDYTTLVEGEKLLKKGKIKGRGKRKKRKLEALRAAEEDTFQVNTKDPRFESLYTNPDFSVDPTSSHYKDTRATRTLETERRQRRESKLPK